MDKKHASLPPSSIMDELFLSVLHFISIILVTLLMLRVIANPLYSELPLLLDLIGIKFWLYSTKICAHFLSNRGEGKPRFLKIILYFKVIYNVDVSDSLLESTLITAIAQSSINHDWSRKFC